MAATQITTLKEFAARCELPSDIKPAYVFHPDLDETWVHLQHGDQRITVSFCDDDEQVYVVLRSPGERKVYHDSIEAVIRLVKHALSTKDAS